MSRIMVPAPVVKPRKAAWRDEEPERPLWEMFPPKGDRCPSCRYRKDAPGHKNAMH